MKRTLEIIFTLDNDKNKTISLSDPKEGLTQDETEKWANNVISKKAFIIGGALPTEMKDAYIRKVDEERLA